MNSSPVWAGSTPATVATLLQETGEPFSSITDADVGSLLERIGNARIVLLGEASHGTSEFYRMRARITQELIVRKGFTAVAVEADWPDASWIDRYVRHAREVGVLTRCCQNPPSQCWCATPEKKV
jgi:erythromycin esterase-like protein